jgi:hypothetical protein
MKDKTRESNERNKMRQQDVMDKERKLIRKKKKGSEYGIGE